MAQADAMLRARDEPVCLEFLERCVRRGCKLIDPDELAFIKANPSPQFIEAQEVERAMREHSRTGVHDIMQRRTALFEREILGIVPVNDNEVESQNNK